MVESKQIKVDNWGIFFLQRLQQFYKKSTHCDLTLLFDDHVKIRVHRLVLNACTEYFQVLEKTCPVNDDCLRMPSNLPSDIVIPIINFMYSGILDLNESSFDRLYSTAKLMNMSVLTKLLDAQKVPLKPLPQKRLHATPISWHTPVKKIIKPTTFVEELPETLPGRKLPIWKRKSLPISPYLGQISSTYESFTPKKVVADEPPKPTRFDWPETDDNSFDNAFDDISYESKPLIQPTFTEKIEKSPKPGPSNTFEEIKKTAGPIKRSASPLGNQSKKVNLQDVKEYLKEHKIRSDYINYEDEEGPDNDLQSFENENEESLEENSQSADDTPNKSILKNETGGTPTSNKHVRFSLEGEEDKSTDKNKDRHVRFSLDAESKTVSAPKGVTAVASKNEADMSKHTKIIAEVLKKYPHLVKNNKNIRLKIMAKGPAGNGGTPKVIKTPANNKTVSKVSYMVVKPDEKQGKTQKEPESYVCSKCEKPQSFDTYHRYRQHLTMVHNEKQDSQMCMICGHVSRKQNLLVYHKFVKHNITPPAMYNFPKCKECGYVALSQLVLQKHMLTHTPNDTVQHYTCELCDKKFVSETIYNTHMERNHPAQIKQEESDQKPKEKIKILSDVKVLTADQYQTKDIKTEGPTEPSSEAEALSNVASGIAASLGLVDTIVVLDDNQFILQSQGGNLQQNIITNPDGSQEYIIPDMQLNNITTTTENQPTNVLSQTIKTGITSTDELVMVLTDHDYGDGQNAVITDNNIVVLYSHPVQTQAGTMMLTSEGNMIEVDKNYAQNIPVTIAGNCEESIEMIQQEINNQLDPSQEVLQVEGQSADFITQIQKPPLITVQSNVRVNPPEIKMEAVEAQDETNQDYKVLNPETGVLSTESGILNTESRVLGTESGVLEIESGVLTTESEVLSTESGVLGTEAGVMGTQSVVLSTESGNINTQSGVLSTESIISTQSEVVQTGQSMPQILQIDSNGQICTQNKALDAEKGPHFEENGGQIVYVAADENLGQMDHQIQMDQQIMESESMGQENSELVQENPEMVHEEPELVQNAPIVENSNLTQENLIPGQESSKLVSETSEMPPEGSELTQEDPNLGQENSLMSQECSEMIQDSELSQEDSNFIQDPDLIQENVDQGSGNVSELTETQIVSQNQPESENEPNLVQYSKNLSEITENTPAQDQNLENLDPTDQNLTDSQQDLQNSQYITQTEGLPQENPNIIQTEENVLQTQENVEEISVEQMEVDQVEDNQVPIEENTPQEFQMEVSQVETQETIQDQVLEENLEAQSEFPQEISPENVEQLQESGGNEEQSDQIRNEGLNEPQEDVVQEDGNLVENSGESPDNVPYEERLPVDASIEQIGDIPQIEENDGHGSHFDNVNSDVITSENQSELEQIDGSQSELEQIEGSQLDADDSKIDQSTADDSNENKMAATDQVQTDDDTEENGDNSQNVETTVKDKPLQAKHDRIMNILEDWDDGESDSQQSLTKSQNNEISEEKIVNQENSESIKKLIDDWEEEEDT